jgi:hypothetical protein
LRPSFGTKKERGPCRNPNSQFDLPFTRTFSRVFASSLAVALFGARLFATGNGITRLTAAGDTFDAPVSA